MRSHGSAAILLAFAVALLASASPAAAVDGGTPAPLRSGGAAYGSALPRPDSHPVASLLRVAPREVVAGQALPQIRVRLRQRGITRVRARVVVVRLPGSRPVARVTLGWVRPGRRVTVRWPAGTQLRAGRYVVRLHARDSRGRNLARTVRYPGRTRIVVHRAPAVVAPAPAPGVVVAPPAPGVVVTPPAPVALMPPPAPSPGGKGVFPVAGPFSFGGADARFGAGRVGHIHQGQDIAAAGGIPVVAPYAGVVSSTSYQASGAGEYVVLDAVDGRDYFFAHCARGSTVVVQGATVAPGQPLCLVGNTGTADGTHLHLEIWNVGWRVPGGYPVDPLPELRGWCSC
jgi:murein DD-endopeptidase MepM/ murein hydrolase activator NlpD